jgi:hypothetical protein
VAAAEIVAAIAETGATAAIVGNRTFLK